MSEISECLRRAERLRAQIEELDRTSQRSRVRRVYSNVVSGVFLIVVVVLAVDGVFAFHTFRDDPSGPGSGTAVASGPSYTGLEVFENFGRFAGQVEVSNPFDHDMEVLVEVAVYDGDQMVGEISGSVTLKPNSTSMVELVGYDESVPFTDSRVHLDGWPL